MCIFFPYVGNNCVWTAMGSRDACIAFDFDFAGLVPLSSHDCFLPACHFHFTIDLQELAREPYWILYYDFRLTYRDFALAACNLRHPWESVFVCMAKPPKNMCCFGPKKFILVLELQQNISDVVEPCKLSGTQVKLFLELSINNSSRIIHILMHRFGQKFFLRLFRWVAACFVLNRYDQ